MAKYGGKYDPVNPKHRIVVRVGSGTRKETYMDGQDTQDKTMIHVIIVINYD